jgi:hypothetical protein
MTGLEPAHLAQQRRPEHGTATRDDDDAVHPVLRRPHDRDTQVVLGGLKLGEHFLAQALAAVARLGPARHHADLGVREPSHQPRDRLTVLDDRVGVDDQGVVGGHPDEQAVVERLGLAAVFLVEDPDFRVLGV